MRRFADIEFRSGEDGAAQVLGYSHELVKAHASTIAGEPALRAALALAQLLLATLVDRKVLEIDRPWEVLLRA